MFGIFAKAFLWLNRPSSLSNNAFGVEKVNYIGHFTVVCSVTLPLNASETGVDLALIQTFLLFHSNAI